MGVQLYYQKVSQLLQQAVDTQAEAIAQAAGLLAGAVKGGGVVFTFGTGHSHLIAEEVMYRAGTLVPVYAILEDSITGNREVTKSEFTERLEGFAEVIFNYHRPTPKDAMVIISTSGRNAVPVEMAMVCRAHGVPVVALTSVAYSRGQASRHSSGKRLFELADVVIDNCGEFGDAALKLEGLEQPVGPTSGVLNTFLIQALMVETVAQLLKEGVTPPVFFSGNLDGAREKNDRMLEQYWSRIRSW